MRELLVDLVARMATPEPRRINSGDSISWKAHREAEALDDASIVDELAEILAARTGQGTPKAGIFHSREAWPEDPWSRLCLDPSLSSECGDQ
jgi:hypothetical protein